MSGYYLKEQTKDSSKSDKEKQVDAKKQEDPIEKVDVCNALKKLDNLIDGDNSICSYSDVNRRIEINPGISVRSLILFYSAYNHRLMLHNDGRVITIT